MDENQKVTTAQYEAIIKRMDSMQQTQDIKFASWDDTTRDITNFDVRLKTVEAKVDGARDDIADLTKKVLNKMDEHLQPIPDVIANQVKESIGMVKKKKWLDIFKKVR